ncbi:MAG: hypothetical protein KJO69_06535 [Gammaproteobacteria bacterium]|nr:hypothetical protein [Gammaproteobacteria bacterium]
MAEEQKVEIEESAEEQAPEYSEVEQEAIEHGWNPEGAEGKRNLTAEEFMDRKPLYDEIRSTKKQVRRLQEGMDAMKQFQEGIRTREREKTIQELTQAKKVALEAENYDAVVEIDDKIAQERVQKNEPQDNLEFESWVDNNEWYHQDSDMKQYADTIGAGYYQQNQGKPMSEVYNYVTEEVKKRFPEKFGGNPNRGKPNPVEGATAGRRGNTSKKYSARDLPEADRGIMKTLLRTSSMTEEEYLKQYFGE